MSYIRQIKNSPRVMSTHNSTICLLVLISIHLNNGAESLKTSANLSLTFTHPELTPSKLNHLAVDKISGRVYIGAVNWLFQLSPILDVEVLQNTTLQEDKSECYSDKNCSSTTPTDNFNKILLLDYQNGNLIVCGSAYHGMCEIRDARNVSILKQTVEQPIAANTENATTVAFIAPGPQLKNVIYTGVTYSGSSPYSEEIPAVSSRTIDACECQQETEECGPCTSDTALGIAFPGTKFHISSIYRDSYTVNYVYGFSSRGFSYFLTTQPARVDTPTVFISKLIRICQNDPDYYSYTEIPIRCQTDVSSDGYNLVQAAYVGTAGSELASDLGITSEDDVLYAVFSKGNESLEARTESALCVYSLRAINQRFKKTIQDCFNGIGDKGLDFANPSSKCLKTPFQILDDFCGIEINTPLGGEIPITSSPAFITESSALTAVIVNSVDKLTVAFLGTSDGHLLKVLVKSSNESLLFADSEIDRNSSVNADLLFDSKKEFLYVMTESKLVLLKIHHCETFQTCNKCFNAGDPYCGWCSLQNKCSVRSECTNTWQDSLNWQNSFRTKVAGCVFISNVIPNQVERTSPRMLLVRVKNLAGDSFTCVFNVYNKDFQTEGNRTANGVACPSPPSSTLPIVLPGQNRYNISVSLKDKTGSQSGTFNVTVYDCNSFKTCTECVSSAFLCDWCIAGHVCTHEASKGCKNDILVTGISKTEASIRSGPEFCPRIVKTHSSELLIPSKSLIRNLIFKVQKLQPFIARSRFSCQVNIEGRIQHVTAQLVGDKVHCRSVGFTYTNKLPELNVTIAVLWDGNKPLDNPDNIHVLLYRCSSMADNCGQCLLIREKYNCGWCQSSNLCQVKKVCNSWLDKQQTCPNPLITEYYPSSGPIEGGTKVTIRGINLGMNFVDIQNGVSVAGFECVPIKEEYIPTRQIVCKIKIQDSVPENKHAGPVIINVKDLFNVKSNLVYTYVNPVIKDISPRKGPVSGGTNVTIHGEHLNAGSKIEAYINDIPCRITNTNGTHAECKTSPGNRTEFGIFTMKFDEVLRTLDDIRFHYVEDPRIISVEAEPFQSKGFIRGIPSGGIIVHLHGENFDAVLNPSVHIIYQQQDYKGPCTVSTTTDLKCQLPSIPVDQPISVDDPLRLRLAFQMDNVWEEKYILLLYPDPSFMEFDDADKIKHFRSDYLTINGENIDLACKESDMTVEIGSNFCNITSISKSQLTCRPTISKSAAETIDDPSLHEVTVIIGQNRRYKIGYLSF